MNFETVIGLEVHVELNTNSKIFSPTSAHFGNEQNANTNVIDWSFPGVLPVLNKGVVDAGIKAALALNMDIHQHMHFDRKNYFYPDNPKAYQISQFDEPIGYNGWIEVQLEDGSTKKIGIERAHLEEDAGKNTHGTDGFSYVDLNRQGVPLIEIVSEADMRSPEEAYAYLTALERSHPIHWYFRRQDGRRIDAGGCQHFPSPIRSRGIWYQDGVEKLELFLKRP